MVDYTSWENTEGVAIEQVATFCRHLLSNQSVFDDNTNPPIDEVNIFLTNNYAKMSGMLAKYGISADQTDLVVRNLLLSYQVYMTCIDVEMTQKSFGGGGNGSPRFLLFERRAKEFAQLLESGAIASMSGIVIVSGSTFQPFATGTSWARQEVIESDDDFKRADITRGIMNSYRTQNRPRRYGS